MGRLGKGRERGKGGLEGKPSRGGKGKGGRTMQTEESDMKSPLSSFFPEGVSLQKVGFTSNYP